jgi:hypothetical protein
MPTTGQAKMLHSNVNAYVSWAFIAVFTFGCGLILWHAAFGINPVEKMLLSSSIVQYNSY